MKVLVCHNFYQQPGGEDQVFADETALLQSRGHQVERFTVHNDAINHTGKLALAGKAVWNRGAYAQVRELVSKYRPQVVHFHNTFPLISPAAYSAARAEGAAVVQTLHNYRLLCPNGIFYREGGVCEQCLGKLFPWPSIVHRCYRESRAATAVAAGMLALHRVLGTWRDKVDAFVALTEFSRDKFITGGLPPDRVTVKPNFVYPDPGPGEGNGGYAVYVGRLADGKGLEVLLEAWEKHPPGLPLKLVGDGPLADDIRAVVDRCPDRVQWLGRRPLAEVYDLIGDAALVVYPSLWYEGLPKVVTEAFARGTPVLASNIGSLAELVDPGRTGLHFEPGDARDLAAQVKRLASDPAELRRMRAEARGEFDAKYTADQNYRMLLDIYRAAVERRRRSRAESSAVTDDEGAGAVTASLRVLDIDPATES